MAYIWIFAGIAAGFFVLQAALSGRVKNFVIKSIPAGLLICGLLFCLITYMGILSTSSPSVIAENQFFAKAFALHILFGLAGCMAGAVFVKMKRTGK